MSRTANPKLIWHEWTPGLDNDHQTLGEVMDTLPGLEASKVPWIIRLFENPSSWLAFPGAITLARHDAVHVLAGRGLMNQDEAFVIGFTMGAAKNLKNWQVPLFEWIACTLYKPPYRFTKAESTAYRLGVAEGFSQGCADLHDFPFEDYMNVPLKDLRKQLGIDRNRLYSVYAYEKILLPDTKASKRLDIDLQKLDPSALVPPEGEDVKHKKA